MTSWPALKEKIAARWRGRIFGRVRTSTAALVVAFIALFWVHQTFQPQPAPTAAPATQVVPPGFVADPDYTWVPRTQVQEPTRTRTQTTTPTTTTTTTPSETTTTTTPSPGELPTTTAVPTTVVDPDGPGPAAPTTLVDPDGAGPLPPQTVTPTTSAPLAPSPTPTTTPPGP
jgi:hypothetical protein